MSRIFLGLAALPLMGMAQTGAMVVNVGGSAARSCYLSAEARDASSKAMGGCDMAVQQGPLDSHNLVASHVNRGILHLVRNSYPDAEADFDRAMALSPNQPEAWLNSGIAQLEQGRAAAAEPRFEKALALRTTAPAIAYYGLALAKEDRGDLRGAYADLKRATELSPQWTAPVRELKRYRLARKGD